MIIHARNFVTSDDAIGGSIIEKSLRFQGSQYFNRSPSGDGNRRTFTLSLWIKRGTLGEHYILDSFQDDNNRTRIGIEAGNGMQVTNRVGGSTTQLTSSQKLKDFGGWYHLVFAFDTTQATSSNRIKYYLNGVLDTNVSGSYPSQNGVTFVNHSGDNHTIGVGQDSGGLEQYFKGYMAEMHFIDGVQLDASYFGYTDDQTGIWRPKRYTYGNYGTHGFYLDFLNTSGTTATTLGRDKSGNPNNFTPNNFSVSANLTNDSMPDTPSKNFCTLNALNATSSFNFGSFAGGLVFDQSSNDQAITGTLGVTSGKWYWEIYKNASQNPEIGIETLTQRYSAQSTGSSNTKVAFITNNGEMRKGADSNSHSFTGGSAQTGAGWIRIACDMDNKKIWFSDTSGNYFNSGNPATGTNEAFDFSSVEVANGWTPFIYMGTGSGHNCYINFGQFDLNSFSSNIPTGFKTLNSKNLIPDVPSIRPQKHFETVTYSGTGSTNKIESLEFDPDLVWVKRRDSSGYHIWTDTVRGASNYLVSNTNDQESVGGGTQLINGFVTNGFQVGTENAVNNGSGTYVAWCWKAGGTAVSNSDGSITTSISANQEAGFSIVTYTGTGSAATIGHGLGKTPKVVLTKLRDTTTQDWFFMTGEITGERGKYIKFNTNNAIASDTNVYPNTATTSTVYSIGTDNAVNGSGSKYVAYCWSEIPGYSKFGSYTGNGSSDGTYVHLGFSPAFIMVKRADSTNMWLMMDNKRYSYNTHGVGLKANDSSAEFGWNPSKDFLSNGFKIRTSDSAENTNGGTYIYMAFAEQPVTTPFDTFPNAR